MVIKLKANISELILQMTSDGWCEINLIQVSTIYRLGADRINIIITRLIKGLEERISSRPSGTIKDIQVTQVLSLAETHVTIFAGSCASHRILFLQGDDGGLLTEVDLSSEERENWLRELKSVAKDLNIM